jgi:hypothetical protein
LAIRKGVVGGRRMQQQNRTLEEMVKQLPPEMQDQVRDYIEFLLEKRIRKPKAELKL